MHVYAISRSGHVIVALGVRDRRCSVHNTDVVLDSTWGFGK